MDERAQLAQAREGGGLVDGGGRGHGEKWTHLEGMQPVERAQGACDAW